MIPAITYDVAKDLAAAGYPQTRAHFWFRVDTEPPTLWCTNALKDKGDVGEPYAAPTVGELVDALGDHFYSLSKKNHGWEAWSRTDDCDMHDIGNGDTPEAALAILWLRVFGKNLG